MLADTHVIQARDGISFEADIPPDPDRGKLWPPIPTPVVGRFAQVRPAGDIAAAGERPFRLARADERQRRTEEDYQFVFPVLQDAGNLPAVGAELIVGFPEEAAIEGDLGQRIQSFADKEGFLLRKKLRIGAEELPVFPVALGHPLHREFVIADKRIRDAAERQQVGVHAARDVRGKPRSRSRLPKPPFSAEILFAHGACLLGGCALGGYDSPRGSFCLRGAGDLSGL
jgi:hypothetical protein